MQIAKRLKIVLFSGAGISAESGLRTFRGNDGLWEGYRIEEVATPEAWARNLDVVQEFYNIRRKACLAAKPNRAHFYFADLEKEFDIHIITQNIDDLHERSGSTNVLHLHGEIRKAQSSKNATLVYDIDGDTIHKGQTGLDGSLLRPHVVWFGEPVPNMLNALQIVSEADILIVVGTSLQVYPAASLVHEVGCACKIVVIDPGAKQYELPKGTILIAQNATSGVEELNRLLDVYR